MPVTCQPQSLIDAAVCFDCIPIGMQMAVQTMLIAQIAGDTRTPQELADAAKCFFNCIPHGEQIAVQNYLLCQYLSTL